MQQGPHVLLSVLRNQWVVLASLGSIDSNPPVSSKVLICKCVGELRGSGHSSGGYSADLQAG